MSTFIIALLLRLRALPWTAVALTAGIVGIVTGGCARRCGGTLEHYGGALPWSISRWPGGRWTLAITLGHVILGRDSPFEREAYSTAP